VEVAEAEGCRAYLIASLEELDQVDITGVQRLGLTSGASTPESLLNELCQRLKPTQCEC
jgi:4-hydroxy-3-methylbut-2-enyl diphosphate reductase